MLSTEAVPHTSPTHPPYPYLGEHSIRGDKTVVLFTSVNTGMVVHKEGDGALGHVVGYYSNDWIEHNFEPCCDQITLVNN